MKDRCQDLPAQPSLQPRPQKCDPATNQMHPIRCEFRIQCQEEGGTGLAESLLLARVARLSEAVGTEVLAIVTMFRNC